MTTPDILAETDRLLIRNWREADRDLLFEICSDPVVLTHFPGPQSRAETDEIFDRIQKRIAETGLGFPAIERKSDGETLGFCGVKHADVGDALPQDTVEIGWRLAYRHWGQGYVTESAKAALAYGFDRLKLSEIVSFAVPANTRSKAVMERIGLKRDLSRDFIHPLVPDTHRHLKHHVLYAMNVTDWQRET